MIKRFTDRLTAQQQGHLVFLVLAVAVIGASMILANRIAVGSISWSSCRHPRGERYTWINPGR